MKASIEEGDAYMKISKLVFSFMCVFVAIIAIVTAIVIFRNEIADCCANFKEKFNRKNCCGNGEYSDYADI